MQRNLGANLGGADLREAGNSASWPGTSPLQGSEEDPFEVRLPHMKINVSDWIFQPLDLWVNACVFIVLALKRDQRDIDCIPSLI
jgi:hypothetical protein